MKQYVLDYCLLNELRYPAPDLFSLSVSLHIFSSRNRMICHIV